MSDQAMREMSLDEYIATLPQSADGAGPPHRAASELSALYAQRDAHSLALLAIATGTVPYESVPDDPVATARNWVEAHRQFAHDHLHANVSATERDAKGSTDG